MPHDTSHPPHTNNPTIPQSHNPTIPQHFTISRRNAQELFAADVIDSPASNTARYRKQDAFLKTKTIAHNFLGCALMLLLMVVGAVALLVPSLAFAQQSSAMQTWQQNISNTVPPQSGCYEASYPNTQWQQVSCSQAQAAHAAPTSLPPQIIAPRGDAAPAAPAAPAGAAASTGSGTDYIAVVPTGNPITSVQGSFANVTGVNSVTSAGGSASGSAPNSYSLQINTNPFHFSDGALCRSSTGTCTGWQQFIYDSDGIRGYIHLQYWILGSGTIGPGGLTGATQCPASWHSGGHRDEGFIGCYIDSGINGASMTPAVAPSNLGAVALIGKTANGSDTAIISINGKAYTTVKDTIFKALPQSWNRAEFNVFGYDSEYHIAYFNDGASLTVKTAITNGTVSAPTCSTGSTTGEQTNLYFNSPCCPYGGANPLIAFVEGTKNSQTTTCPALGATLGLSTATQTPTYYTVTANANPSGTATFSPSSAKVASGDTVLVTMTQKAGYGMTDAAYVNGTSCPLTTLGGSGNVWQFKLGPITSNCDFVGYFGNGQPTYTVTARSNPNGTATFSPASVKVAAGTTVEVTMTQKNGYGMTDAAYINGTSCPLAILGGTGNVWKFRLGPINSNCDFEGYFGTPQTPTYVISALASPSNLASFSPASVRVAAGTTVLVTMTQQAGHGMTSGLYTTGTGTTCPMTTLGGSGNVYQFKIGPVSGNCTFQGYFK